MGRIVRCIREELAFDTDDEYFADIGHDLAAIGAMFGVSELATALPAERQLEVTANYRGSLNL